MRAGLSTRRGCYKRMVSMGAGLPTQRVSGRLLVLHGGYEYLSNVWGNSLLELLEFMRRHRSKMGLHRRHPRTDSLFELGSFVWCHRSEEGLHLLHFCFGRLWRGSAWTVPGVVSFLLTSVTRSSYVDAVLPRRGIVRSIRRCPDLRQRLAEPGYECVCSSRHVVCVDCSSVHLPLAAFVFRSSLFPTCSVVRGLIRKLLLMSPLSCESYSGG